jgi:hypothetical protein
VRGHVRDRPRRRQGAHAGALALAVGMVVAALTGCGGDGNDTAGSPPTKSTTAAQGTTSGPKTTTSGRNGGSAPASLGSKSAVGTAVVAVLTSTDPVDACDKYVTDHYLNVAYGGRQGCVQAQAPGSAARSLRSFRIVQFGTQGTIAVAEAVPNGGPYDGSKVVISLLFGSDHYRVDRLHANVPVGP